MASSVAAPSLADSEWESFLECCSTEELSGFLDKLRGGSSDNPNLPSTPSAFKPGSLEAEILALQNNTMIGPHAGTVAAPLILANSSSPSLATTTTASHFNPTRVALDSPALVTVSALVPHALDSHAADSPHALAARLGLLDRIGLYNNGLAASGTNSCGDVTSSGGDFSGETSFHETGRNGNAQQGRDAADSARPPPPNQRPHAIGLSKLGPGGVNLRTLPAGGNSGRGVGDGGSHAAAETDAAAEAMMQDVRSGGDEELEGGALQPSGGESSGEDAMEEGVEGGGGRRGGGRQRTGKSPGSLRDCGLGIRSDRRPIKLKSHVESQRRKRISEGLKKLRDSVNGTGDTASMLDEAVAYVESLKQQVSSLQVSLLLNGSGARTQAIGSNPSHQLRMNLDASFLTQALEQQQQQQQHQQHQQQLHQHHHSLASPAAALGISSLPTATEASPMHPLHSSLQQQMRSMIGHYPSLARYTQSAAEGGNGSLAAASAAAGSAAVSAGSLLPRAGWSKQLVETSTGGSSNSARFNSH